MRRLVACVSVKGAPGVTTTALAMAAAWPVEADTGVRPVVVEADAAGGDLGARLGRSHVPGLLDVAAAANRAQPGSVLGAAQELPFGVRAVLAPAAAVQCQESARLLARDGGRILRGGPLDRGTVLVDAGRVADVRRGLVALADVVVLVAGAGVDALAHVFAVREVFAHLGDRVVLGVVGPSHYSPGEIASTVGVSSVVAVPWEPRSAAVFSGGACGRLRSGWRRSSLLAAGGELAGKVIALAPVPENHATDRGVGHVSVEAGARR